MYICPNAPVGYLLASLVGNVDDRWHSGEAWVRVVPSNTPGRTFMVVTASPQATMRPKQKRPCPSPALAYRFPDKPFAYQPPNCKTNTPHAVLLLDGGPHRRLVHRIHLHVDGAALPRQLLDRECAQHPAEIESPSAMQEESATGGCPHSCSTTAITMLRDWCLRDYRKCPAINSAGMGCRLFHVGTCPCNCMHSSLRGRAALEKAKVNTVKPCLPPLCEFRQPVSLPPRLPAGQ